MEKFDVIIIGTGLGGLATAVMLGKEGYRVCLLEKNKQVGGCLQTYARDKVIFDSGVHYIGGLSPGQNTYQIFKYLGILDRLKLQKMDEDAFDKIIFEGDDNEYPQAQGHENFIQQLLKYFPDEEKGLRAYCDKIKEVCSKFPLYNLREGDFYSEKADILGIDTKAFIESVTSNKRLQEVLAGNISLYAGLPDKSPFYVHALVINSYIESSWKCLDGGSQIAKYLVEEIRKYKGEIIRHKEIARIVETDGKVQFVESSDGVRYYGDIFISNIHPAKTLDILESDLIKKAYRSRIKSLENTISTFTLNIVLKPESFPYFKYNLYYHDADSVWTGTQYTGENWPPEWALFLQPISKSDKWAEGMTILAYMKMEDVREWENTFNTVSETDERGASYEEFKRRKAELLIDKIEKKLPNIRSCIQSYYTATPLTYRDYIGNEDGALYGIVRDYKNPLKTFISPRTKVPNLYLTGQNLNLHGILGVSVSAMITTMSILNSTELINKVKNA